MNQKKIAFSFIWKFFERTGTYIVQFVLQIILARILLPEEYGIVAIVTIFISIANVFVQTGFNTSLIQKKEVDDTDYSSVLYLSLGSAAILYIILYIGAPYIALFYNNELLRPVIRVMSLTLFVGAFNSIQNAYIARNMEFKKNFISSMIAIIISGIIGILLAYCGYGVWSLVIQQLLNVIIVTIILLFVIKWRPKLLFSLKRVKTLFSYGWKLLCSALIDNIYVHLYDLVIGKKYTTTDLAYYNRGKQFPYLIVNNVNGSIQSVLLPVLSSKQDNKQIVKDLTRKSIMISSFIMFPLMFGLAALAKPLVLVLLTDKWLECVPFLQILCFSYVLWPIHTANLQAINAMGRSDIFLKLEIIKKIIGITTIIITVHYGILAMAIGQIITGLISSFINAYPNKKLLGYKYIEQIKDILPAFITSFVMAILVYLLSYLSLNNLILIIIQCILGVVIYIVINCLIKNKTMFMLIDFLKRKKANK